MTLPFAAGFVALSSLSSCESTNYGVDEGATPVVEYVRPTSAEASDSLLVAAPMGSTVAIIGSGLAGVNEVWFNDLRAELNPTLVSDNAVVVTVPGEMPGEVTDLITLKTKKGKMCTYSFGVMIPVPVVTSISNEWAADGTTVTLYGNYFFADQNGAIEVLFPGNLPGSIVRFDTGSIVTTVPDGAIPGSISVTSLYGTGRSAFTFRDDSGMFIDGENGPWNSWGFSAFGTEDGLSGSYIRLEGNLGSWAWPANEILLLYIDPEGKPIMEIPADEMADYALRFEAWSHEWHDTPFIMRFAAAGGGNDVDDPTRGQYHWKPWQTDAGKVNYVTDGWTTITIPLSEFNTNKEETVTDNSIGGSGNMVEFFMMPFGAADGTTPLKLWLDNLRIVKIK